MKATNLLNLYMNCNFSRSITETLTMLAHMLGLDLYFTVRRHDIVRLIFCRHKILDILASCQHQRMAIIIFRVYTLSLPTGSLAVIKRGVYKSSLFIFHRELYSILCDFLDQLNVI